MNQHTKLNCIACLLSIGLIVGARLWVLVGAVLLPLALNSPSFSIRSGYPIPIMCRFPILCCICANPASAAQTSTELCSVQAEPHVFSKKPHCSGVPNRVEVARVPPTFVRMELASKRQELFTNFLERRLLGQPQRHKGGGGHSFANLLHANPLQGEGLLRISRRDC